MVNKFFVLFLLILLTGSFAFGTTTAVIWTFPNADLTPAPDFFDNAYGVPLLEVDSCYWIDEIDGYTGVWPLSGQIDVYIPNTDITDPDTHKEILLTLIWKPNVVNTILPELPLVAITPFKKIELQQIDIDLGNGWTESTFNITVWPNPTEEWLTIKGDIMVDSLTIATMCVPEPATIAMLGLGGLALISKRRV